MPNPCWYFAKFTQVATRNLSCTQDVTGHQGCVCVRAQRAKWDVQPTWVWVQPIFHTQFSTKNFPPLWHPTFPPHGMAWGKSRGLTRILRVFSAHSPRILRAFSARALCAENTRRMRGEYAENTRRMRGEYASALRVLSAYFPRILRAISAHLKI